MAGLGEGGVLTVVGVFEFGGWDVAAGLEQVAVVEPVDPFQGGDLDLLDRAPRALGFDQFGLEQADDGLSESVVVGVADGTDRRCGAGLGEAFGEGDRGVVTTS